jgi:eukaryotic-like serine/threonine-protein kinase
VVPAKTAESQAAEPGAGASDTAPGVSVTAPGTVVAPDAGVASSVAGPAPAAGMLAPGALVGPRYEIVRLLGKGGMGAVYLAHDRELGRDVALKLIAPHLAGDHGVLERFKREIHLSSIVTHRNVLRVYDLGESDGVKFLTMQFIDGESLADRLVRERPLAVDTAVAILRAICEGLAAAHENGVLHRDLKPQNVMLDGAGHVYLTDFGLATSSALSTLTQAGALMGTPQYMSPEQVKGAAVDARSDIFSIGVMLYEMLAGSLPYSGDTVFEVMIKRTQAPPKPVRELNAAVPAYLQQLVERCLAIEPDARYASMRELLDDLAAGTVKTASRPAPRRRSLRGIAMASAFVAVLAIGAVAATAGRRLWQREAAPPPKAQTVIVAEFDNRTGESIFNGTLEPPLTTALEGASFLTSFNRGAALRIADQLKFEGSGLGEKRARLVAQREGIGIVVAGHVDPEGKGYRVGVRAVDAFTGQRLVEHVVDSAGKEQVLAAITKLAARVREALGDNTPEGVQLKDGETFSAASLEAAHEYAAGMELQWKGDYDAARARYLAALKLDPDMGRAYLQLAVLEANRSRHAEGDRYFKEAMARVARMTDREKYRTRGAYYLFARNPEKAIEAYAGLVRQYPADTAGFANLALGYVWAGDFKRALEEGRRALSLYPNNVPSRSNVGLFAMYAGDFETAIQEQKKALEVGPRFLPAYTGLALAHLAQGRRDEALGIWEKLAQSGPSGASAAAEGRADLAMFEGRLSDARALLEAGIAGDRAEKDGDAAARKLAMLASIYLARHERAKAVDAAEKALASSQEPSVLLSAGTILAELGQERRVHALAEVLERQLGPQPRMYAEVLRGTLALGRGSHLEAIARFKAGAQRHDSWLAHAGLGRAYLEAGAYTEAQDELERCQKRRGEATDVFIDTVPTYRIYPAIEYRLGRTYEALKSPAAADSYKAFLAVKRSDEDPMVADARRRLAGP